LIINQEINKIMIAGDIFNIKADFIKM